MTHEETLERANENAALREARAEAGRFASPIEAHDPPGVDEWTEEEREEMRYAVAARRLGLDVSINKSPYHFAFFIWDRYPPEGKHRHWMANTAREAYEKAIADNFGRDWPTEKPTCSECGRPKK